MFLAASFLHVSDFMAFFVAARRLLGRGRANGERQGIVASPCTSLAHRTNPLRAAGTKGRRSAALLLRGLPSTLFAEVYLER
ncbi:MAG TPA: hypothetical protein VL280_08925, partial [Burkholderiales bacterium]|nr:hypothetical protein [Burkholderiales bacterium]